MFGEIGPGWVYRVKVISAGQVGYNMMPLDANGLLLLQVT